MTVETDLEPIVSGDTRDFDFNFTDSGGSVDITGWEVWITIKDSITVPDSEAAIQKSTTTHDSPLEGITTLTLNASETKIESGNYYYDIQVETDAGLTYTIAKGHIYVEYGVTDS
jgi:hypothetical protein